MVDFILPIGSGNLSIAVGLVGHGRWGQRHLSTLIQLKTEGYISELYVCDIDPGQLDALPETVNGTFPSLTEMLREVNIDVLGIATPPDSHLLLAKQACDKGVHFLVEKPLGIDYDKTVLFLDTLPPAITMVVGYLLRHHPGIMVMQEHLSAEKEKPFMNFHYKRRTQRPRPHGATPIDTLAIHALDLCSLLLGLPLAEFNLSGLTTSADSAYIKLDGEDGQQAIIDVAWGAQEEVRQLTLSGAEEEMELDFGTHDLVHRQFGIQPHATIDLANEQPLYQEWRFILASVQDESGLIYPSREELLDQARWLANHR